MIELPLNAHVDARNHGYYVAGTRISLDSIAYALRRGETAEEMLADFPALCSRNKLDGAIAFIEAHPAAVDAYLTEKTERWERARKLNPPELVEKVRRHREGRGLRSA